MIEENLPPFSEAYSQGRLINEDDDYFADEHEDLLDLSLAFAGTFCVLGDEINCPYSIAKHSKGLCEFPCVDRIPCTLTHAPKSLRCVCMRAWLSFDTQTSSLSEQS